MNSNNICPDGFPFGKTDEEWSKQDMTCDYCGDTFDSTDDESFLAKATGDNGEFHKYAFCCYECACEFREKHGLVMNRLNECCFDLSFEHDPTAKKADPVADAVKSIDLDNADADQSEPTDEQPALVDDPVVEKKAAECLQELVRRAREITLLDTQIADEKRCLKKLQAERDDLVKRQQDFILANADGFQMTFDDCDKSDEPAEAEAGQPAESTDAADELPPEPDNSWRSLTPDTQLLVKLTDKQWDAVLAAFPTLGSLQDWLCQDRREKIPGISQTVYDKLVDALNDYVTAYVANKATDAK